MAGQSVRFIDRMISPVDALGGTVLFPTVPNLLLDALKAALPAGAEFWLADKSYDRTAGTWAGKKTGIVATRAVGTMPALATGVNAKSYVPWGTSALVFTTPAGLFPTTTDWTAFAILVSLTGANGGVLGNGRVSTSTTPAAAFTGSIAGTVLTAGAPSTGTIAVGQNVVIAGTTVARITSLGTGSGGAGTYNIDTTQTVASTAMNTVSRTGGGYAMAYTSTDNIIATNEQTWNPVTNAVTSAPLASPAGSAAGADPHLWVMAREYAAGGKILKDSVNIRTVASLPLHNENNQYIIGARGYDGTTVDTAGRNYGLYMHGIVPGDLSKTGTGNEAMVAALAALNAFVSSNFQLF